MVTRYRFKCKQWHTPVFTSVITEAFVKPFNKKYMQKFRKTTLVEAIQWTGHNATEIMLFVGKRLKASSVPHEIEREHDDIPNDAYQIEIPTEEGVMVANKMDWICKGIEGECWPVRRDIFEKTYESVEQTQNQWTMTTQERIKAEAVKLYPFPEQDGFRAAYIAGVTAENERAQVWADALEEIAESNCDYESTSIAGKLHKPDCRACRAKEALELWKGKEVGDGA